MPPHAAGEHFYRVQRGLDLNGHLANIELTEEGDNACRCMLRLESVPFKKQKLYKKRPIFLQ